MSPRTALAAGLLAAALATAGCGADIEVRDPGSSAAVATTPPPTTAAPTTTAPATTPATTPAATSSGPAGALPATFPLPPGATVQRVVTEADDVTATITVPDGRTAYTFWTSALPAAGYPVGSAEMVGGIGAIAFSGPGCPGASQLGFSGTDITVLCNQS